MINKKKLISKDIQPIKPKQFYLYFLFNNKEIVYIGETNKINQRISTHKRTKKYWLSSHNVQPIKEWTHYRFITSSSSKQTKKWEKRLIKFYTPKYNVGHNCNSLYKAILKQKKIKGKTVYYSEYVKKNSIKPEFKKTKKGVQWTNFNPFKERIIFRNNNWYAYDKESSLKRKHFSRSLSEIQWSIILNAYNIRKINYQSTKGEGK